MRRLLVALCFLALLAPSAAAAAVEGEQRVLVVLATWGPEPFTQEDVRRVALDEVGGFFRASSFGRASLVGDVTPWLRVLATRPDCDPSLVSRAGQTAAGRAGFDPRRYDRLVYLFPRLDCPFSGYATGHEAWLNGRLSRFLVAHELGHTFGLGHASAWSCVNGACEVAEYGNPYNAMGSGDGDYGAYEKFELGWLSGVTRPAAAGSYTIGPVESAGTLPQALVVPTARSEYWLEYRAQAVRSASGSREHPPGVLVVAGPNPSFLAARPLFPRDNLLLSNQAAPGRLSLAGGERYREDGAFEVVVDGTVPGAATLRFSWLDTTPPRPPRLLTPGSRVRARGGALLVTWDEAVEQGSGTASYEVRVDGRPPVRVPVSFGVSPFATVRKPPPGRHAVSVVAVDRAGNRSAPSVRRFTVRGR